MKPAVKNTIIFGGLLLGAIALFALEKVEKLKRVFEKLLIEPKNIREVKLSLQTISFVTDILLTNPSEESFDVSGYVATLSRLNFFYKGKYLGTAKPTLTEINVPANNKLELKNIPVVLSTSSLLQNVSEIYAFSVDNLTVEAVITIAGKDYYIN